MGVYSSRSSSRCVEVMLSSNFEVVAMASRHITTEVHSDCPSAPRKTATTAATAAT